MSNRVWIPGYNKYPAIWDPSDSQYLVTSNSDFLNSTSSGAIPAPDGVGIGFCELVARNVSPVSGVVMRIGVAGINLNVGQNFAGLYDRDGNLLARTADQKTTWQSTSIKKMPWDPAFTDIVIYPGKYYVAVLCRAGDVLDFPRFSRGSASENCNVGYDNSPWRYAYLPGVYTQLPLSVNLAGLTEAFHATFVGLWK